MGLISISTIVTSIVMTVVTAVAGVFCTPLFDSFKSSVEALHDPLALNKDRKELNTLLTEIKDKSGPEEINKWIDDANELINDIQRFWFKEIGLSSSSNNKDDHLSGCLFANNACSRYDFSRRLKAMISQGERLKQLTLVPELFEKSSVVERETVKQISAAEPRTVKSMRTTEPEAVGLLLDFKRETVDHTQELLNIEDGTAAERSLKVGQTNRRRARKKMALTEDILDVPNVQDGTTGRETVEHIQELLNIEDGTAAERSLKVGQTNRRRARKKMALTEDILDVPNVQDGTTGRETVEHIQELLNIEDGTAAERSLQVGQIKTRDAKKKKVLIEDILDLPNVQDGTTGRERVGYLRGVQERAFRIIRDVVNVEDVTVAERTLKRVMDALKDHDDDAWCIKVWGPGGLGKTTLAKAVNNKVKSDSSFSLVRLIELTANDEQNNVRDAIAKSLKLDMRDGIEDQIRNRLQREKFLLILDNVWSESIHLPSIGIPERQAGCKILLTTRFRRVCTKMEATAIEMGYLTGEEAWQLFAEKAGEVVNDEKIKALAEEVCYKCGCLPLVIVVVGSAMKGKTIDEWQNAVNNLRCSVPMDADIKSKVYDLLKLSYDLLDDTLKACFLYCSLFPEGCYIEKNELVQCWLAENLIDMGSNNTEAYNKGLGLIKKLEELCLLEQGVDGDNWAPQTVKMHDMVRDVARSIGKSMKRSVVFSGYGISMSPIVQLQEEIEDCRWIAVVENRAIILPQYQKDNSSVTTILLRGSNSEENLQVSMEFLNSFRAVKVLNIEGVRSFVASLLQLKELHTLILRNCSNMEELPNQNNLKVLVLSYSDVRSVPIGMKELSNLKELDLSYTSCLESVHRHIISNLNVLEVLNMSGSGYRWPVKKRSESEEAALQDLLELQSLREVYVQLADADGTYEEFIEMDRLQRFFLAYSHPANRINDGKVFAINMEGKSIEVGSLILHADSLILHHIENVNEIFAHVSATDQSNSKVKSLEISKSGFGSIPEWLSLEILRVIDCPMLKKLSFMPSIKEIRGSIEWWETVEWDSEWHSEEIKSLMNQHFISLD